MHAPLFTCTVKAGNIERKAEARSKADAKGLAAAAVLGVLAQAAQATSEASL